MCPRNGSSVIPAAREKRTANLSVAHEPSEKYGGQHLGEYFEGDLDGECAVFGLSREELRAWRPERTSGRK